MPPDANVASCSQWVGVTLPSNVIQLPAQTELGMFVPLKEGVVETLTLRFMSFVLLQPLTSVTSSLTSPLPPSGKV